MRAGKGQLPQLGQRTPVSIVNNLGRPTSEFNAKDVHLDLVARDCVSHLIEWFKGDGTQAEKIFRELATFWSVPVQFDIGKFPESGVDHVGRTPANEEASLSFDNEGRKSALG